jgi:hypothetical protein
MTLLLDLAIRLIGSIDFRRNLLALGVLVMIPVLIMGFWCGIAPSSRSVRSSWQSRACRSSWLC